MVALVVECSQQRASAGESVETTRLDSCESLETERERYTDTRDRERGNGTCAQLLKPNTQTRDVDSCLYRIPPTARRENDPTARGDTDTGGDANAGTRVSIHDSFIKFKQISNFEKCRYA